MGYSAVAIPDILEEAASLASSNSSVDTKSNSSFLLPTIVATAEELSWFGMHFEYLLMPILIRKRILC
jgi:hypothetical protein